ncbi:hypothetical protein [Promicromonospora iranensis]|uniref:Secreted protein n=1 Tax=Promicromonospora iranensis TaxID=1105144 RepID=A0ABU2CQG1_9MICO|nr:hypothetical protein [Promicromonospora iranensis]MDR7383506.1 hypothetical protein [Promicromonospora iranensis]
MSETLWGVLIGAVVGVASAAIGPMMTARHQRATTRAERVHKAIGDVEAAHDAWMAIVAERVHDRAEAWEAEFTVSAALRRLSTATSSYVLRREAERATDELGYVTDVLVTPDENYAQAFTRATFAFSNTYDEAMQIAVEIVDPPFLPVRAYRWVARSVRQRRYWLRQRQIARAGGM